MDSTDIGKLYINYPMIESYQHLEFIPDLEFYKRKIPVSLRPGIKYKELVSNVSVVENIVNFPHKIDDLLKKRYGIGDRKLREICLEKNT